MNRLDFLRQWDVETHVNGVAKSILEGVVEDADVQIGVIEHKDGHISVLMADLNPDHQEIAYRCDIPKAAVEKQENRLRIPMGVVQAFRPLGETAVQAIGGVSAEYAHPRSSVKEGDSSEREKLFARWNAPDNPYQHEVVLDWTEGELPTIGAGDHHLVINLHPGEDGR